jgi:hypothetical protein
MTEKTINISGIDVKFRASAAIPRMYRVKYGRDIMKDLNKLQGSLEAKEDEGKDIPIDNLELFENVAYIMAKHADPDIPQTVEDWLEQFDMFSIYEVLPQLLDLWKINMITTAESKKNYIQQGGK